MKTQTHRIGRLRRAGSALAITVLRCGAFAITTSFQSSQTSMPLASGQPGPDGDSPAPDSDVDDPKEPTDPPAPDSDVDDPKEPTDPPAPEPDLVAPVDVIGLRDPYPQVEYDTQYDDPDLVDPVPMGSEVDGVIGDSDDPSLYALEADPETYESTSDEGPDETQSLAPTPQPTSPPLPPEVPPLTDWSREPFATAGICDNGIVSIAIPDGWATNDESDDGLPPCTYWIPADRVVPDFLNVSDDGTATIPGSRIEWAVIFPVTVTIYPIATTANDMILIAMRHTVHEGGGNALNINPDVAPQAQRIPEVTALADTQGASLVLQTSVLDPQTENRPNRLDRTTTFFEVDDFVVVVTSTPGLSASVQETLAAEAVILKSIQN